MDFNRKVDPDAYSAADMPQYPARVLTVHCAMKGLQLGSVAGLLIVTPSLKLRRKSPWSSAFRTAMPPSLAVGVALSLGLLAGKAYQGALDVAGVDDRAYRIAKSEGQVKVDNYSVIGGLAGATVGMLLGRAALSSIVSYSGLGVSLGIAYYLIEKSGAADQFK